MPTMYLFRGMPGSGKSTVIDKLQLKSNTLSLDTFRELFSGITLDHDGLIGIDQSYNNEVFTLFNRALNKRLRDGVDIVIDNLNLKVSDINTYLKKAKEFNYDCKIVNFKLENLDFYLKRNEMREKRKRINPKRLEIIYDNFKKTDISSLSNYIISVNDFEGEMSLTSNDKLNELNKYRNIILFGDIKGSTDPLMKANIEYNTSDFFIFTGNYFQEGRNPSEVFQFLKLFQDKDNVVFLKGDDEIDCIKYLNSIDVENSIFKKYTANFIDTNKKELHSFFNKLQNYYLFTFNDKKIIVSHAGVPIVPEKINLINADLFYYGCKNSNNIDSDFERNVNDDDWYQIHCQKTLTNDNEYNNRKSLSLNGHVQNGGFFKILNLSKRDGFKVTSIKNNEVLPDIQYQIIQKSFSKYKSSKLVDKKELKKMKTINDATVYYDKDKLYYFYNDSLINIKTNNGNSQYPMIVTNDNFNPQFLTYDEKSKMCLLFDYNYNLIEEIKPKDIDSELFYNLKDLNTFFICNKKEDHFDLYSAFRKDYNKNQLNLNQNKYYIKDIKVISLNNEKAYNGFIKSNNNSNFKIFLANDEVKYISKNKKKMNYKR